MPSPLPKLAADAHLLSNPKSTRTVARAFIIAFMLIHYMSSSPTSLLAVVWLNFYFTTFDELSTLLTPDDDLYSYLLKARKEMAALLLRLILCRPQSHEVTHTLKKCGKDMQKASVVSFFAGRTAYSTTLAFEQQHQRSVLGCHSPSHERHHNTWNTVYVWASL